MAAIIDSAPDCIKDVGGAQPADDSADFILQAAYEDCAYFENRRLHAHRLVLRGGTGAVEAD